VWVISPESPGWDADVELQFSDTDSAAILVGRDPAYILSLGIRHHGSAGDLLVLLGTIRAAVDLKLREEALASQMRQAKAIQQSLLPRRLPEVPGFDLAAVSLPADEVGGDVYDMQWVEAGVLGIMLADASGHGLPAALQARDVVTGLRMGQAENRKITATVSQLNNVIHRSGLSSRFISLFYGELEESGNFAYVNGGHCPPLLLTPGGEVFELKTCGPVLGPLPDAEYRRGYLTLRPGEVLVLFTDGVTERTPAGDRDGPEEFGREGIVQAVTAAMDRDAAGIAAEIIERVRRFGDGLPFSDDVSLVVVKRLTALDHPPAEDLTQFSVETRR
jgi:sigma-B regulation protein RsbU (phosphoserine phosphatase)